MNRHEGIISTRRQKLTTISARGFINAILVATSVFAISTSSFAQQGYQPSVYLDHGLLHNGHLTGSSQSHFGTTTSALQYRERYNLEEAGPYYFAFESHCHIDPFARSEDGSKNRKILAACLKNQLWENENIPLWIRATGATVLIGAAGSAGKVDDDLRFQVSFEQVDDFLREWLDNKAP